MPEYLDPEIAGEGTHADAPIPGWMTSVEESDLEWQPPLDPPHINDYAAFKTHKRWGKYFRPWRYQAFPAFMYHMQLGSKVVKNKEEALALGPEWTSYVPIWFHPMHGRKVVTSKELFLTREGNHVVELSPGWAPGKFSETAKVWEAGRDMGAKSLPVKSDTQRLTEALVAGLTDKKADADPASIAAIVAAVMAAVQGQGIIKNKGDIGPVEIQLDDGTIVRGGNDPEDGDVKLAQSLERSALLELAEKEGVKVDGRWSNERLKKELGLE